MDSQPATLRIFLALWPDEDCKTAIARLVRRIQWPEGASVYASQDWHVTLQFLGNVAADKLPALQQGVAMEMQPVTLALDCLWPWQRGLVMLGASCVPHALADLQARLAQRLLALGLGVEATTFRPHVTLARRAPGAALPTSLDPIRFHASRFALVESTGDKAQRYRCLRWFG